MTAKARPAARHTSSPSPLAGEGGAKAPGAGDISTHKATVNIFCDGACRGNPGPGGWGAVLRSTGHYKELSGFKAHTTNNEMELTAAIESLSALKNPSRVTVTTDSEYVMKGMREWIHGWRKNGWKTASKKPVKNRELWQALSAAAARHEVDWKWVRGHAGHPENERADQLANEAMDKALAGR